MKAEKTWSIKRPTEEAALSQIENKRQFRPGVTPLREREARRRPLQVKKPDGAISGSDLLFDLLSLLANSGRSG